MLNCNNVPFSQLVDCFRSCEEIYGDLRSGQSVAALPLTKKVPSLESHDFSRGLERGRERRERPRVISMRKLARGALEKSASNGAVKTGARSRSPREKEEKKEKEGTDVKFSQAWKCIKNLFARCIV